MLNYKGKSITFSRSSDKPVGQDELFFYSGETISFTYYGFGMQVLHDLVQEAFEMEMEKTTNKIKIHSVNYNKRRWTLATVKDKRRFDTLTLDDGVLSRLDSDLDFFLHNKNWCIFLKFFLHFFYLI